ncbi:zona pellucida sperm-binding protein 2-like [Spea bombifrons]|uniref:zona pellucida sperm-binding protein 2-like n=1 Tax=Spea bombifrons TaxID=233779 RepID=UPI00234AFF0D|nr:zona pellucida sperm-binding protein 2-like [Spea bombifrons]
MWSPCSAAERHKVAPQVWVLQMVCVTPGTMVPFLQCFKLARLFLLGWSLIAVSETAGTLDFPGAVSCLDDGLQVRKPKGLRLASWNTLQVIDSAGIPVKGCSDLVEGKTANIPARCIKNEMGTRLVLMKLDGRAGLESSIYRAVCSDMQADDADDAARGTVVNCAQDFMMIAAVRPPFWSVQIHDGQSFQTVSVSQARAMGYILTSDPDFMTIQASFDAVGFKEYTLENQKFYVGAVRMTSQAGAPRITVDIPMICSRDAVCSSSGFMTFEILDTHTLPKLNLNTVIFGDGTCLPTNRLTNKLSYNVSLLSCGTRTRFVNGRLTYENEARALRKDFGRGRISRDSELRITVRCYYSDSGYSPLNLTVVTVPPPVSSRSDGPLSLKLDLFPDDAYRSAYTDSQYPVVKTLREPIFLEVRVLNRDDPNIELVLDDCWATMSRDPTAVPQWNIVVDGCQEARDDRMTIFHAVGLDVPYPTHHKRFEVKAFAFMSGGEASTNLIYIHCSATICNKMTPDFPLCTKTCPASRPRRDLDGLQMHKGSLVSLPGPVLMMAAESSVRSQDETSALGQVTIGLLPAFALIAVTLSGVGLVSVFKAKNAAK